MEDWVWQKGTYAPSQAAKRRSGFRILFAQSTSGFARGVPTSLHNARVLEGLELPSCSLCSFQQTAGVFSSHALPKSRSGSNGSRLGITQDATGVGRERMANIFRLGVPNAAKEKVLHGPVRHLIRLRHPIGDRTESQLRFRPRAVRDSAFECSQNLDRSTNRISRTMGPPAVPPMHLSRGPRGTSQILHQRHDRL